VRAEIVDITVPLAIRAVMVQFGLSLDQLINSPAPVPRQPEITVRPAIVPVAQPAETVAVEPVASAATEAAANLALAVSARAELAQIYKGLKDEAA
jgi:hypothetical protein